MIIEDANFSQALSFVFGLIQAFSEFEHSQMAFLPRKILWNDLKSPDFCLLGNCFCEFVFFIMFYEKLDSSN